MLRLEVDHAAFQLSFHRNFKQEGPPVSKCSGFPDQSITEIIDWIEGRLVLSFLQPIWDILGLNTSDHI
jgi:hypothetical protein